MNIIKKIALPTFFMALLMVVVACVQSAPPSPSSGAQPSSTQSSQPTLSNNSIATTPSIEEVKGVASFDRNFLIVFDDSGSMSDKNCGGNALKIEVAPGKFAENRIDVAKWATDKFVRESVPSDVNLGFYPLNNTKFKVPLGKDNRDRILAAIESMNTGGSRGTPLNYEIQQATNLLSQQRALQLEYGEYYVIVVTDGEATDDGGRDAKAGAEYALRNKIPIITIGFCLPQGHGLREHSWKYRNVLNADQLLDALKETQAELPEYDSK